MKITIYELLGLVKDGKAPKKIKYNGDIYFLESDGIFEFFAYKTIDYNKFNTDGERLGKALFLDNCYMHLYSEVEILDEPKDNSIERLDIEENAMNRNERYIRKEDNKFVNLSVADYELANKINELIDEVNKLKEE